MKKLKVDNLAMSVVMLIVCASFMSVMFMQFKTVEETDVTDIKNMREAELRKTLAEWKAKYQETATILEDTNKKIEEYKTKIEKNQEASGLIDKELKQSNVAVGKTDVVGEGVTVTLYDGEPEKIYAWDLIYLVNELKYAGAEAISINDVRITNTTYIVDLGDYTYILIGDKGGSWGQGSQRLTAPYVVKAIGNEEYLSSVLKLKDSGYLDFYRNQDKRVEMTSGKRVQIPKYNGEMKCEYLKVEEEKE